MGTGSSNIPADHSLKQTYCFEVQLKAIQLDFLCVGLSAPPRLGALHKQLRLRGKSVNRRQTFKHAKS